MEDSSAVLVDFYGFLRWYGVYREYCLPMLALTHTLYSFVGGMLYHCGEAPQCVYDLRVGGYNGGT